MEANLIDNTIQTRPRSWLAEELVSGGGEMANRIRDFDWSQTPLGPLHAWPQSLRTAVSIILSSQHPMWIGWGSENTFLYNDPYISVLSQAKHPWALGRPASEVWAEIWDICGPLSEKVSQKGEASFLKDVRLFMSRGDFLEETYFSFSYSPIRDESGKVAGLFCPSSESTEKILSERRIRALSEVAAKALIEKTVRAACARAAESLTRYRDDIPFALIYLIDPATREANLEQAVGLPPGLDLISPIKISLDKTVGQSPWPFANIAQGTKWAVVTVSNVNSLPHGVADQKIREAVCLPIATSGQDEPLGILVAGVNPGCKLSRPYRSFYELIAGQIGAAIQSARVAEQEKKRSEELSEIDRAKTQFFSNVSHEFRTPLTLMLGPLEDSLVDSQMPLNQTQRKRQELIHRNALRLLKLVNSLLHFARIEAGRVQAVFEPLDLAGVTTDLASVFRSAIERAGLQFVVDVEPISQPVFVDRELWEKIVLNLLSNALKFTFSGKIELRLVQTDDRAILTLTDTGTGIAKTELPNLFKRFHRIEGARGRSHEGTGIGLALIQELVKIHGGAVQASSELGVGSTFTVSLPMGSDHLPKEQLGNQRKVSTSAVRQAAYIEEALHWLPEDRFQKTESKSLAPGQPSEKSSLKVLLADDNADMRNYVKELLSPLWEVETYSNGEEALRAALSNPPNLVLTDVMMPKLDGFGLLKALRTESSTQSVPVILLSARAGEEAVIEGVQAGADDYLVKPFSAKELIARVKAQFELGRLREEILVEKNRLNEIFQQAPLGIVVLEGPEHLVTLVNPKAMSLAFGGERDMVGKPLRNAVPELLGQPYVEWLDQVYSSGIPHEGTSLPARFLGSDGIEREIYVDFIMQPKRNAQGKVDGVLVVYTDVTEKVIANRKLNETTEELKRHAHELARSNQELAQFAYVASHDLKEPLRVIRTHLQLVEREAGKNLKGSVLQHMGYAVDAAGRMYDLVNDLLEYARAGASKEEAVDVDTNKAVQEATQALSSSIDDANADITVDSLPKVIATHSQIVQLFQNLIGNALKFHGPNRPRIRVSAKIGERKAIFSVADNGIGINPQYSSKIFEVFQRLHDRGQYPGTGIGLAICKKIVEQRGGNIWVESVLNEGATFHFSLPLG